MKTTIAFFLTREDGISLVHNYVDCGRLTCAQWHTQVWKLSRELSRSYGFSMGGSTVRAITTTRPKRRLVVVILGQQ